ncbi:hypothetical protein F5B20DRAFT_417150 [Whalleya microplaca]|nr:hypothetical protein F5B20DRAFT_417150 [Whalleya microplaca]
MEEEHTTAQLTVQEHQAEPFDPRPESSPYTAPYTTLYFGDGPPLSVPVALIDRHPTLSFRRRGMSLNLEDIPGDSGHIIVHYLFTGTYQCLKPKGSSPSEKRASEFATSVRMYTILQDYELPALKELVRGEMKRLGRGLPVTQLFNVMTDAHAAPKADDIWLRDYIKSLVEPLFEDPHTSLEDGALESPSQNSSLASVLLGAMIALCREKMDLIRPTPDHFIASQCQEESVARPSGTDLSVVKPPEPSLEPELQSSPEAAEKTKKNAKERRKERRKEARKNSEDLRVKPEPEPEEIGLLTAVKPDPVPAENPTSREQMEKREKQEDDTPHRDPLDYISSILDKHPNDAHQTSSADNSLHKGPLLGSDTFVSSTAAAGCTIVGNKLGFHLSKRPDVTEKLDLFDCYYRDMGDVPLMHGAKGYIDVYEGYYDQDIYRFPRLCVQKEFMNFSLEELRWKQQLFDAIDWKPS